MLKKQKWMDGCYGGERNKNGYMDGRSAEYSSVALRTKPKGLL